MKKKYLFTMLLGSLLLSACTNNKKLVCNGKGKIDGRDFEVKMTLRFDKEGKYSSHDGVFKISAENIEEEKLLLEEKDVLCEDFVNDEKEKCTVTKKGRNFIFKFKNISEELYKNKTKDEIKEIIENYEEEIKKAKIEDEEEFDKELEDNIDEDFDDLDIYCK